MEYANQHNIILKLNDIKDEYGYYPLLATITKNNTEMVEILIDYANQHHIILNLNQKNKNGEYPLSVAIEYNNIEIIKLLIEYSNQHQIILEYDSDEIGDNPEIIQILQNYEEEIRKKWKNEILESIESIYDSEDLLNELCNEIKSKDLKRVEILFQIFNINNIILEIDKQDNDGNSLLYWATKNNNTEIVNLLIEYAEHYNINLEVNAVNVDGNYSLLNATSNNNFEMAKLLINYVENNNIPLNINVQNIKKNYPLDWAIHYNNIEMVKLLIDYSTNNDTLLDINQKNENGNSPITEVLVKNNDIEIIKLLMEYAKNKGIILNINENEIEDTSNIKEEAIILLLQYEKEHLINIDYKINGRFLNIKSNCQTSENSINNSSIIIDEQVETKYNFDEGNNENLQNIPSLNNQINQGNTSSSNLQL